MAHPWRQLACQVITALGQKVSRCSSTPDFELSQGLDQQLQA